MVKQVKMFLIFFGIRVLFGGSFGYRTSILKKRLLRWALKEWPNVSTYLDKNPTWQKVENGWARSSSPRRGLQVFLQSSNVLVLWKWRGGKLKKYSLTTSS